MIEDRMLEDADLNAYVDGQLDMAGRLRVEQHLAQNPELAARVMADLGIRTTLKLALGSESPVSRLQTREAARRLGAGLEGRQTWLAVRRVAAVIMLVSAGWLASNLVQPFGANAVNASTHPPDFVGQAVRAHQTALLRQAMPSQAETGRYDPEDIRSATGIVMPALPKDWRISNVQVFPSDFGPSVEASLISADGKRISLFAVRPGHFAVDAVEATVLPEAEAAWWQVGEVAYAVISGDPKPDVSAKAKQLQTTLY